MAFQCNLYSSKKPVARASVQDVPSPRRAKHLLNVSGQAWKKLLISNIITNMDVTRTSESDNVRANISDLTSHCGIYEANASPNLRSIRTIC